MCYKVKIAVPPNTRPGENCVIEYEIVVTKKLKRVNQIVLKVDSNNCHKNTPKSIPCLFCCGGWGLVANLIQMTVCYVISVKRNSKNLIYVPIDVKRDEDGFILPGNYHGEVTVPIPHDLAPSHSHSRFLWRFYQELKATIAFKRRGLLDSKSTKIIDVVCPVDPYLAGGYLHENVRPQLASGFRPKKAVGVQCKVDCEFKQFSVLTLESVEAKIRVTNNDCEVVQVTDPYLSEVKYSRSGDFNTKTSKKVKIEDGAISPGETREFEFSIPVPKSFTAFFNSPQFQCRHFISFKITKRKAKASYQVPLYITNDERGTVFDRDSGGSIAAKKRFTEFIVYPDKVDLGHPYYWQIYPLRVEGEKSGKSEENALLSTLPQYTLNAT